MPRVITQNKTTHFLYFLCLQLKDERTNVFLMKPRTNVFFNGYKVSIAVLIDFSQAMTSPRVQLGLLFAVLKYCSENGRKVWHMTCTNNHNKYIPAGYSPHNEVPQGEILIGGGQVALGYYKNEEKTKVGWDTQFSYFVNVTLFLGGFRNR